MKCKSCGEILTEDARFCPVCGAKAEPEQLRCPGCGAEVEPGSKFCGTCGCRLIPAVPEKQPAADPEEKPPECCICCRRPLRPEAAFCGFCGTPRGKAKRKAPRAGWICSITALILAVMMLAGSVLVPVRPGTPRQPEPAGMESVPVSASAGFEIHPVEGLTISAEPGALDRDREFRVTPLSEQKTDELTAQLVGEGVLVYSAMDIDAGMDENTQLPGTFRLSMDLEQLEIPPELWDQARILRQDDDGSFTELNARIEDGLLVADCDHNSVFLYCVGLGLTATAYVAKQYYIDRGVPNESYAKYTIRCKSGNTYNLMIPQRKAGELTPAARDLEAQKKKLIEKYAAKVKDKLTDDYLDQPANALQALLSRVCLDKLETEDGLSGPKAARELQKQLSKDPKWKKIQDTEKSAAWEKNLYPRDVSVVLPPLRQADEYLFRRRMFPRTTHTVDVFIIENPKVTVSKAYAHEVNLLTTRPFLKVYTNSSDFYTSQGSLLLTMTHELFHVVQNRYCFVHTDAKLPFMEATAVMLEGEAFEYYNKHGTPIPSQARTDRNFWDLLEYPFLFPDDWPWGEWMDENTNKDQGYTLSNFLEFMRDKYKGGESWLKKLMQAYKYSRLWTTALAEATSGSESTMLRDFTEYCVSMSPELVSNVDSFRTAPCKASLSPQKPEAHFQVPTLEFSTRVREITVSDTTTEYTLALVSGKDNHHDGQVFRAIRGGTELGRINGCGSTVLGQHDKIWIQEINAYLSEQWTDPYDYHLFLLEKPPKPEFEIKGLGDEEEVVVTVPSTHSDLITCTVAFCGTDHVYALEMKPGADEARLPVAEILEETYAEKLEDVQLCLWFQVEPAEDDPDQDPEKGPNSEYVKLKKEDILPACDYAGEYTVEYISDLDPDDNQTGYMKLIYKGPMHPESDPKGLSAAYFTVDSDIPHLSGKTTAWIAVQTERTAMLKDGNEFVFTKDGKTMKAEIYNPFKEAVTFHITASRVGP